MACCFPQRGFCTAAEAARLYFAGLLVFVFYWRVALALKHTAALHFAVSAVADCHLQIQGALSA